MRFLAFVSLVLALVGCGGGGGAGSAVNAPDPTLLKGIPELEVTLPLVGETIDNYITLPTGSLAGKSKIVMRYTVDADEGVTVHPKGYPKLAPKLTLYFQRHGDDWTAVGPMEAYRWYAKFSADVITPGEHTIEARFDENWTAVMTSSAKNNPQGYRDALANAERVGFVLGGGDGVGHGVYATGYARITVSSFVIE